MTTDQIETLLRGKPVSEALRLAQIVGDPVRQVVDGLDFTNVAVTGIAGAVKFCVFDNAGDQYDPAKFASGYVTYVNGPMSPLYRISEADLVAMASEYPPEAMVGLRNSRVVCAR